MLSAAYAERLAGKVIGFSQIGSESGLRTAETSVTKQVASDPGENGAGWSTLIRILTGAYQPDEGELLLDGQPITLRDPLHGQGCGIGTVYQEVNLLPNRSVAETLFLGRQPTRRGLVDRRRIDAQARELLARYGLDIDVRAELSEDSVAVRQIVAIARAVELSGKVLVLDEPTASLDRNEVQRLFEVVRGLKAEGSAIIFITHFLDQVFDLADRVTILCHGKKVATQAEHRRCRADDAGQGRGLRTSPDRAGRSDARPGPRRRQGAEPQGPCPPSTLPCTRAKWSALRAVPARAGPRSRG